MPGRRLPSHPLPQNLAELKRRTWRGGLDGSSMVPRPVLAYRPVSQPDAASPGELGDDTPCVPRVDFGPISNSYDMVQPNSGAELHTVAIPPDVFVTCYVEDPYSGYYGGMDDRTYHMVVAGRVNPDLSITFGTPYPSSQYDPIAGYFDDISDLCYVGNNVVMIGNRRDPPATFLHVDTATLAITEIGAIYSPAIAGGDTGPGNAVKAMSNHSGDALVLFDYDPGGGYVMAWVTTDGSSISYTWDNAPNDEVGYWFTWYTSHWVPVADGVVASGAAGAMRYIIDWSGQSISAVEVPATDMWTSFAQESAVTTPAPGSSTYDLVWVNTADTLLFKEDNPVSSASISSSFSPIGGARIGQSGTQPYAYFTNMARLPDQSFLLTWMDNAGNTRYLTWFRPGESLETWPIAQIAGSSFWYYDGVTITYVGDGRFVLCWTENAEDVEDWGNEIYWRVGQYSCDAGEGA